MNEAQLKGIDMDQLEAERFTHPNHYDMLKKHFDQVREFEIRKEIDELRQKLEQFPDTVRNNAEKIRKGKRVQLRLKDEADYVFTDIQLKIAEEILARHTGEKN
jgi:uncharacterized protein with von Willebrand factor type A (vWA) domain